MVSDFLDEGAFSVILIELLVEFFWFEAFFPFNAFLDIIDELIMEPAGPLVAVCKVVKSVV